MVEFVELVILLPTGVANPRAFFLDYNKAYGNVSVLHPLL